MSEHTRNSLHCAEADSAANAEGIKRQLASATSTGRRDRFQAIVNLDWAMVGAYLFFIVILLQNTVALAFVATGLDIPVSPFYAIKFLLMAAAAWVLLVTRNVPKFKGIEVTALLIVFVVVGLAAIKGGGLAYEADEVKFYLVPILLYFIGRVTAPFKRDRQMAHFLVTLGLIYMVLGTAYMLISREALVNGGLSSLLDAKQSDVGRADGFVNGVPGNFYFFLSNGDRVPRAFGPLFDPLASANFGATLVFFLWELQRRKVVPRAGLLTIAVAILVCLSMTRAMVLGLLIVFLASLVFKKGLATMPIWPALLAGAAGVAWLAANLATVIPMLDSSSGGHLRAYLSFEAANSLIGQRFAEGSPRGEESLYSTIFFECGIIGLGCFLTWFAQLYFRFRKAIGHPYARATYESLIVYLLASFTTEHMFAASSCGLFWFLLGNTLTTLEREESSRKATASAAESLSHSPGAETLPA